MDRTYAEVDDTAEGTAANPRRVTVWWSAQIQYSDLPNWEGEDQEYLYAIIKGSRVLYVGIAYEEYVHERLASHTTLRLIVRKEGKNGLKVTFGEVRPGTDRRVSKQLIRDVENLVVCLTEPPYNKQLVNTYYGRELVVKNMGPGNPFRSPMSSLEIVDDL